MPITAILIPAALPCNWAGYRTFNVMVLKCRHYITRITFSVSQTLYRSVPAKIQTGSLVW